MNNKITKETRCSNCKYNTICKFQSEYETYINKVSEAVMSIETLNNFYGNPTNMFQTGLVFSCKTFSKKK